MSEVDQILSRRGIGGLLMRGALARLQMAVAASLVLWACVMWASLSHPVPPKSEEPPPPSPPALRRIVGTGQQTPIGGIFDRFDVESQPIIAPVNARGEVAFYATILRNKATEGIFLARAGHLTKVAAVGDSVPGGGILTQFAQHPLPQQRIGPATVVFMHGRQNRTPPDIVSAALIPDLRTVSTGARRFACRVPADCKRTRPR